MENVTFTVSHHSVIKSPTSLNLLPYFFVFFLPMLLLTFLKFLYLGQNKSTHQLPSPLPPGPKPWPLVGCLPTLFLKKPIFRWIHKLMKELNTDIACIRLGNVHVITVTCPDLSCQFFKTKNSVFSSRPLTMCTQIASNGYLSTIFVPYGEQWKKMKRVLVSEMLSPARHKFFHGKRLEEANHLVRYLYNQCKGGASDINIRFVSQHYCGNLIRKILFSKRTFGNRHEDSGLASFEEEEYIDAVFTLLRHLYAFCVSDYLPWLKGLNLDGHEKVIKEANKTIRKYHDPIIEERIKSWSINGKNQEVEDLLDIFVTLKDSNGNPLLSKHEIQAQITDIMLAVLDNPANAIEWALAEMINQPKILAKAVEELDKVAGKERLVEESDFTQLNYIKACVREAFRLHPVTAFNVPHESTEDTIVGNYFIPRGSQVFLSRMGLGRNHKVWDEPLKFKPERHLNGLEQVTLIEPNLRFISFSTGSRGCPGVIMGTSMALMLFARLLQGFTWSIPSNGTSIDLNECANSLALAKPLIASAIPRLPTHVYFT